MRITISVSYTHLDVYKRQGQRRVRASELAGINTVPAFVLPLDLSLIHISEKRVVRQGQKRRSSCAVRFYSEDGSRYERAGQAHSNP